MSSPYIPNSSMYDIGEWRADPMPEGPYILVDQLDLFAYEAKVWLEAMHCAVQVKDLLAELPKQLAWGTVALAKVDGRAKIVAHRYDSSD